MMMKKLLSLLLMVICFITRHKPVKTAELIIVNRSSKWVVLSSPRSEKLEPKSFGRFSGVSNDPFSFNGANAFIEIQEPQHYQSKLPYGPQLYAIVHVVDTEEEDDVDIYQDDTNHLQVCMSDVLLDTCIPDYFHDDDLLSSRGKGYMFNNALYGNDYAIKCLSHSLAMPENFVEDAFRELWYSIYYWALCNRFEPAQALRSFTSQSGYKVDILRDEPLVAAVRNFITKDDCKDLLKNYVQMDDFRVGTLSRFNEKLTHDIHIGWDQDNLLSRTAAGFFDLVSELIGKEIPYEGQEPLQFDQYLYGFEHTPFMDCSGDKNNPSFQSVATTLAYCQLATKGGGTIFPHGELDKYPPLRFQPENAGDVLFFEYAPNPGVQLYANCPVIEGSRSIFKQKHRLGVSADNPWTNYEDWGFPPNPLINTRWEGQPRYGKEATLTKEVEKEEL